MESIDRNGSQAIRFLKAEAPYQADDVFNPCRILRRAEDG